MSGLGGRLQEVVIQGGSTDGKLEVTVIMEAWTDMVIRNLSHPAQEYNVWTWGNS